MRHRIDSCVLSDGQTINEWLQHIFSTSMVDCISRFAMKMQHWQKKNEYFRTTKIVSSAFTCDAREASKFLFMHKKKIQFDFKINQASPFTSQRQHHMDDKPNMTFRRQSVLTHWNHRTQRLAYKQNNKKYGTFDSFRKKNKTICLNKIQRRPRRWLRRKIYPSLVPEN